MNLRHYGALSLLTIACAAGSYLATYAVQQQAGPPSGGAATTASAPSLTDWLQLTPQQAASVREVETGFAADRTKLEGQVRTEREALAKLLENSATTNDEILMIPTQSSKMMRLNMRLELRMVF